MSHNPYIYILIMAAVTFAIRVLPLTLVKKQFTNTFVRSFLYYVPYVTLSVMTFPAIIYSTADLISGIAGTVVGVFFAYKRKSLLTVAVAACLAVLLVSVIELAL